MVFLNSVSASLYTLSYSSRFCLQSTHAGSWSVCPSIFLFSTEGGCFLWSEFPRLRCKLASSWMWSMESTLGWVTVGDSASCLGHHPPKSPHPLPGFSSFWTCPLWFLLPPNDTALDSANMTSSCWPSSPGVVEVSWYCLSMECLTVISCFASHQFYYRENQFLVLNSVILRYVV